MTTVPVALHGAGRTADEADDIIGSAAAARTRGIGFGPDLYTESEQRHASRKGARPSHRARLQS